MAAVEAGVPVVVPPSARSTATWSPARPPSSCRPATRPRSATASTRCWPTRPGACALRDAARARADAWTYREYFARLRELIGAELGARPASSA